MTSLRRLNIYVYSIYLDYLSTRLSSLMQFCGRVLIQLNRLFSEVVTQRYFVKTVFLRILQNSKENASVVEFFKVKDTIMQIWLIWSSSHENNMTKISLHNTFYFLRYAHLRYIKCLFTNIPEKLNMLKVLRNLQTSPINNFRILRVKNAKFSGYYFYMNTNI